MSENLAMPVTTNNESKQSTHQQNLCSAQQCRDAQQPSTREHKWIDL